MTEIQSYPYWKLENGAKTRVRFLFDSDKTNYLPWREQIFLNFRKYLEDADKFPIIDNNNAVAKYVWDSQKCSACGHMLHNDLGRNLQNLYQNLILKHYYAHIYVVDDGLSLYNNEIMKLTMHETFTKRPSSIFNKMKDGLITIDEINLDINKKGNDFIIKITKNESGIHFSESRWSKKQYLLKPKQISIINNANLPPLSAYLEEPADDVPLMTIFNRLVEMKAGFLQAF